MVLHRIKETLYPYDVIVCNLFSSRKDIFMHPKYRFEVNQPMHLNDL